MQYIQSTIPAIHIARQQLLPHALQRSTVDRAELDYGCQNNNITLKLMPEILQDSSVL